MKNHYRCSAALFKVMWHTGLTHLQSYPMFSHLQQQKMQIKKPMMRSAPATDSVMIKIWKFTEFHNRKKRRKWCIITGSSKQMNIGSSAWIKWTKQNGGNISYLCTDPSERHSAGRGNWGAGWFWPGISYTSCLGCTINTEHTYEKKHCSVRLLWFNRVTETLKTIVKMTTEWKIQHRYVDVTHSVILQL